MVLDEGSTHSLLIGVDGFTQTDFFSSMSVLPYCDYRVMFHILMKKLFLVPSELYELMCVCGVLKYFCL